MGSLQVSHLVGIGKASEGQMQGRLPSLGGISSSV